jgi:hypothetical protein
LLDRQGSIQLLKVIYEEKTMPSDRIDYAQLMRAVSALKKQGMQDFADAMEAMFAEIRPHLAGAPDSAKASPGEGDGVTRKFSEIMLTRSDLINQVYLNEAGNYSVKGYNERLKNSFGEIYLGLDKGADYDKLSDKPNAAIRAISTEQAFNLTLGIARRAVATSQHPREFDLEDLSVIVNKTLADLCTYWFGLPDDIIMVTGRIRESDIVAPARCPGDFSYTSAAVFKPNPGCMIGIAGQTLGRLLKDTVAKFIARHREAGTVPQAALSRAIFEAFPADDDLIGRTIIGVMMGFLPTTFFNLVFVATEWWKTGAYKGLQQQLKANKEAAFPRAKAVLEIPMIQSMQRNCMPDAVWRTAVKKHTLGNVEVNPGDMIHINIVQATKADQAAGTTDVFPIFGGDRRQTPHPQHACPGQQLAMGVMLATLNALLEPQP